MEGLFSLEGIFSIEFTAYVALAVSLYAVREATSIPNRFIPLVALFLGVLFATFESYAFNFHVFTEGIKYGAYGVATVASIKYLLERKINEQSEQK